MNRYVKEFFHRGLMFGGFGPIILAIIYFIVSKTTSGFSLSAGQVLVGIVSVYLLAFVHAGASVFNQIEEWSIPKSLLCHFATLFVAYSLCYVLNSWIPFEPMVLLIFALILLLQLSLHSCLEAYRLQSAMLRLSKFQHMYALRLEQSILYLKDFCRFKYEEISQSNIYLLDVCHMSWLEA